MINLKGIKFSIVFMLTFALLCCSNIFAYAAVPTSAVNLITPGMYDVYGDVFNFITKSLINENPEIAAKRDRIINNAISMKNVKWTPAKDLNGWRSRIVYKKGITYTGLPYTQNGSKRVNADQFINRLNNSADFYTSQGFGSNAMPMYGNDCSGFVCRAWEVSLTNASGIADTYYKKDFSQLKKGDALIKYGKHAMLFEKYDAVDPNKIWVYEQGDWNDPQHYPSALKNGGDFSGPKYHTKKVDNLKANGYMAVSLFK